MYNQTPYGVRRSHSFDSYDNLERWQAIREHRKQFLSTRAKFDKTPPSEPPPPPPPPRHESKFRVMNRSPSSSAVSQLIQNFNDDMKKKNTVDNGNYTSPLQKQTEGGPYYPPEIRDVPVSTDVTDSSTLVNLPKTYRFNIDNEEHKFQALESPGSILKLTQTWQKYKMGPADRVNDLKLTTHQSSSVRNIAQEEKYLEAVYEPPITKKTVDRLGYEQPTFFKEISITTTNFQTPINFTVQNNSDVYGASMFQLHSVDSRRGNVTMASSSELDVSLTKRNAEDTQIRHTNPEQNPIHMSHYIDSTVSKICLHDKRLFHKESKTQKFNTQEDRRIYLESTLKMFESGIEDQEFNNSNYKTNSSDSHSIKPRRTSTGSMREPTVWRNQPPVNPVRTLLQKYSNIEVRK